MQKIDDKIKYNNMSDDDKKEIEKYLNMSDAERQVEFYNMDIGNLNEKDGINCDACKNKGYIAIIENGCMKIKNCECMRKRKLYEILDNCGMSRDQLKNYRFDTYTTNEEWQKNLKNKIGEYIQSLNDNKYWLYLGGNTGAGKTHLCTALFQKLIGSGLIGKYMIWNSEISQLIMLKKSFNIENQERYIDRMEELIKCDVLYIDDFMQRDIKVDESLNVAYEIINSRYNNPSKITIISSELTRDDLQDLYSSVFGRIYQKADNGRFFINITGNDKDYRIKNGN